MLLGRTVKSAWAAVAGLFVAAITLTPSVATAGNNFTIGFVPKALVSPFYVAMYHKVLAEGKKLGVTVITEAPAAETDVTQQVHMIQDLINRHVNALIVGQTSVPGTRTVLREAISKGIKVVLVDTSSRSPGVNSVSALGSDNIEIGRLDAVEAVRALNGHGTVAIILGVPGQTSEIERLHGFNQILHYFPSIKIIDEVVGNWTNSGGYKAYQDIVTAHPNVDLIFAESDEMAIGAGTAMEAKHVHQFIISADGVKQDMKMIEKGVLTGTVEQRPDLIGVDAVKFAVDALHGNAVPPVYPTPIVLVTKSNVATAIVDAW